METELMQKQQQQKKKTQGRNDSDNRNLILLCLTLIYLAVLKQDVMFTPVTKSKLSANSPTFHIQLYPPGDPKLYHWR